MLNDLRSLEHGHEPLHGGFTGAVSVGLDDLECRVR
jgi:hypothetical protein